MWKRPGIRRHLSASRKRDHSYRVRAVRPHPRCDVSETPGSDACGWPTMPKRHSPRFRPRTPPVMLSWSKFRGPGNVTFDPADTEDRKGRFQSAAVHHVHWQSHDDRHLQRTRRIYPPPRCERLVGRRRPRFSVLLVKRPGKSKGQVSSHCLTYFFTSFVPTSAPYTLPLRVRGDAFRLAGCPFPGEGSGMNAVTDPSFALPIRMPRFHPGLCP